MIRRNERIILLTNYHLYGYSSSGGSVERDVEICLGEGSVEQLRDYVGASPTTPTRIVVNVLEEEFIFETVPHAVGADRKALLNRKLNQHYRHSEFKRVVLQGRQKQGRRDDAVMFSSLGGCQELQQLVDILVELETPITGIYSGPQLCQRYLQPVLGNEKVLVMTEIDNGQQEKVAIRQSFYDQGQLRLTRVGMIDVASEESVHHDVEDALESSRRYLLRERLLEDDERLEVIFVTATPYLCNLSGYSHEVESHFSFSQINTVELARILNLPTSAKHGFEDALAACSPPLMSRSHYRSDRSGHYNRYRQVKQRLRFAGVAAACALVCSSALLLHKTGQLRGELDSTVAGIAEVQQQLRDSSAGGIEGVDNDVFQVKDAIDFATAVQAKHFEVDTVYQLVSAGLAEYPGIEIDTLSWAVEEREVSSAPTDSEDPADPEFDMMFEDAQTQSVLVAKLGGRHLGTRLALRDVLSDIESLASTLENDARVSASTVTRMPVNIQPNEQMSGQIVLDDKGQGKPRAFELEVIIDHDRS